MCERAGIIVLAIFAAVLSLSSSASLAESASAARAEIKSRFDLPAEPMDKALRDFALQANCNISYEPSLVAGLQAPAIKGEFTVDGALALILTGTKLRAVNVNEDTIQILEKPKATSRDAPFSDDHYSYGADVLRVAGAGPDAQAPSAASPTSSERDSSTGDGQKHDDKDLEEITVTGTHIRGTKDSPSPVLVFTRADIDATGLNTVQQFLQTLPQNFGSASEGTIGQLAASSQTNNEVNGSAPNLRGLGADATLVLINGHRVAPGNTDGSFVDVSMIPLTAIERIEIVTDGASAIYGSDAVGGVVNIILRSKFDGAETRVQFGSVGTGSMHNAQIGQTVGTDWTTGSALVSYQYFDQTPLSAGSRDYLQNVTLPFYLLPDQVEHGVFANVDQAITDGFRVHGDLIYSHRDTNTEFATTDPIYGTYVSGSPARIDSYSASIGAAFDLPRRSELAVSTTYSESDTDQQYYLMPSPMALQNSEKTKSAIISLDANLDGVLAPLPAGPLRYAIGAQYRKESFGNTFLYPPTDNTFYPTRNVDAGYVELHIPIAGRAGGGTDSAALELTVADREEHYSDFGSTNNPQIGTIWKPAPGLVLRGTYGTSFKAPLLSQLDPIPSQVAAVPGNLFNPAPGGTPNTLVISGGNPELKPEKARVWTVGLDLKPEAVSGLNANLTYYDIVFKEEINVAEASICSCDAFVDEAILGPDIVQRNPPNSLIEQLMSYPTYVNPLNVDPATIGAIFDSRALNLSTAKTRGLDFGIGYKAPVFDVRIDTGISGTYIFTFDNQFSSTAPTTSILNTTYNPIDLRLRGHAIATRNALSAGVYINFTNAYTDNNITPNGHVSSWTTADTIVSYQFGPSARPLSGVSISFSIINLTDRDPPYVTNLSVPLTYDGANANALGRFFSLRLQKRW
jgi:iron complex outermembrane recepter protein